MALAQEFQAFLGELSAQVTAAVANELDNIQYDSERSTWNHNEPAEPFPQHEALDGLEYSPIYRDDALTKAGWAEQAIFGNVSQFVGPIWFPGDHDGCECTEQGSTQQERLKANISQTGETRFQIRAEITGGTPPQTLPGVPAAINARLSQFLRNDIDLDIDDGTVVRRALSAAGVF